MAEIRDESSLVIAYVHRLRREYEMEEGGAQSAPGIGEVVPLETEAQQEVLTPLRTPSALDVLAQVQYLLDQFDRRELGHWNDDDTCIMLSLQDVWEAAMRRGYTLEDLQAILRLLKPGD